MLFIANTPIDQSLQSFNNTIDEGYKEYAIQYENTNTYFRLKIIEGVNGDEVNFGIFLYNINSKSHRLMINVDGTNYTFNSDARGDYSVPAFSIEDEAKIFIVDEMDSVRFVYNIKNKGIDEFKNYDDIIIGSGKGISKSNYKMSLGIETIDLIIAVFLGLIIIFGVVLLTLYLTKKGMFNPEKRRQDLVDYRRSIRMQQDLINNRLKKIQVEEEPFDEDDRFETEQIEEPEVVNMYPYQRVYDDEDEVVDAGVILRNMGFSTDYNELTEEEKNMIMIQLMHLRDSNKIPVQSYQKEVIKLWKK